MGPGVRRNNVEMHKSPQPRLLPALAERAQAARRWAWWSRRRRDDRRQPPL